MASKTPTALEAMKLLEKLLFADLLNAARKGKLDDYKEHLLQQYQEQVSLIYNKYDITQEDIKKINSLLPELFKSMQDAVRCIVNGTLSFRVLLANNDWAHIALFSKEWQEWQEEAENSTKIWSKVSKECQEWQEWQEEATKIWPKDSEVQEETQHIFEFIPSSLVHNVFCQIKFICK